MSYHPELQPRDLEILKRLVYCFRETSAEFEARRYGISVSTARNRLNQLTKGRFLCRLRVRASETPPITAPLFSWEPGDPRPDFGAIAWAAQERWKDRPEKDTTVWLASQKTLAFFGVPPKRKPINRLHATHDLAMNAVYDYCRKQFPQYEFLGEEMFAPLRGHGEGVEDAQLIDGNRRIVRAVEHVGSYRKHRCQHFHQHVSERNIGYLLF